MQYQTEQEEFWAGEFGDAYVDRAKDAKFVASDTAFFSEILRRTSNVESVLELGANVGLNLLAIRNLKPDARLSAVEINAKAVQHLEKIAGVKVYKQSIFEFTPSSPAEFVFTKGVLIHLSPEKLGQVYDLMYKSSSRYICVAEYYSPIPVEVPLYRGHANKLYKRDFAGEILDRYPDLRLVDYGFAYRRDQNFRQDDLNWFLLEK